MVRRHGGPSGQSWWTLLRNHAPEIAAMDLFVVPTLAFNLLYGFIIVRLDRRELVHIAVTNSPTADWIARQITEAFPWESAPGYLIRDRDRLFGPIAGNAWTTSLYLGRRIFSEYCAATRATIMERELTER